MYVLQVCAAVCRRWKAVHVLPGGRSVEENMDKHIAKMIVAVVWLLFILALCLFSGTYWWILLFLATSYIVSIID